MKVGFVAFSCGNVLYGSGYVIGALLEAGHDVQFHNLNNMVGNNIVEKSIQSFKISKAVQELIHADVEVVFFSILSIELDQAIGIVHRIKEIRDIPVVFGGVHVTIVGREFLEQYPEVDYICVGEGESMVKEFVSEEFAAGKIRNLGWRKEDGTAVLNPIRPPEDLSNSPPFPWHIYPPEYVVKDDGIIYVRATRGCPFKCTYCANSAYLNLYGKDYLRKRPLDDVLNELSYLKNTYNPKSFYFTDEMLIWDQPYSIELFRRIKAEIGLPFSFLARVEYINENLVKIAAECGCNLVAMGVECGDESFRRTRLNRRNTNDQIIKAFSLLKKYGIKTVSFNIIGYPFPGEDERIESTVALNKILQPDFTQFSIFYPLPGTVLYDYCIENDLIDWEKQKRYKNLYAESILKDTTLHNKRIELSQMFNPGDETMFLDDTLMNAAIRKAKRMIR